MIFEGFEGFKRVRNEKNLNIEKIYSILEKYQKEMGKMSYEENATDGQKNIIINIDGKYDAKIRLSANDIIIERILEDGAVADELPTEEKGKAVEMAQADRMIEQIYDLIKDYMDDESISEHITASKITLTMKENEERGFFSKNSFFEVKNQENVTIYELVHKKFNKLFSIKSLECHMEVVSVSYADMSDNKFTIQEKPFAITTLRKDLSTEKLRFVAEGMGKKLKISADYTDNHYLIELNEVVIGAVDCLDPQTRKEYRIEINDLREKHLVVSVAIMIDTYLRNDLNV